jgi:PleD family two-component response regulator
VVSATLNIGMNLRILLIESEPEDLLFLHDAFQEIEDGRWLPEWPRIEPVVAATWQEAEPMLSANPPHAILLDLEAADKSGAQTFRRAHAMFPDVPVILMLDSGNEALAVQLIREGAEDFLFKKSIDCAPLAHALRNAVLRRRRAAAARAATLSDSLTGLCNRAGFLVSATRDRKLAERLGQRWMLLIAEPRNLTDIALAFGEQRHDLEVIEAAEHLRCIVTPADALARISEHHFAISVFDCEAESVEQAWERMRNAAADRRIELGVSIFNGQNRQGQNSLSVDDMIEQALADLPRPKESQSQERSTLAAGV